MSDHAAETAARSRAPEPVRPVPPAPVSFEATLPASVELDLERPFATPQRQRAILGMQRAVGNHTVQRLIGARMAAAIQRQPSDDQQPSAGGTHTITSADAVIRDGPPKFKSTRKSLPVGARVDVIDSGTTGTRTKRTYVNLVEHGTRKALGWTAQANLGDVQYEKAAASFVYVAKVKPRKGHTDALPVMVYLPPKFDGTKKTDIVIYFHGDAADYSASTANNYGRENPAIGMHLTDGLAGGANRIVVAPQGNEWTEGGSAIFNKSPWDTLQAGDYESMVGTALTNLQGDLNLKAPIPRGTISIAGHSGGGKALGQAAQDLDKTGDGVKDVTLVEAGYGGREKPTGEAEGSFAKSFQMVRDWLLEGKPEKVLRVITKQTTAGTDTRTAIEISSRRKDHIPVLSLDGVRNAIKAKGREGDLEANATEVETDPKTRSGGMTLIRTIAVKRKDGKTQGTIYVFLMSDPPRAKGVDTHFGVRDATFDAIVTGKGKGMEFGSR
jgi:hypothetical protein